MSCTPHTTPALPRLYHHATAASTFKLQALLSSASAPTTAPPVYFADLNIDREGKPLSFPSAIRRPHGKEPVSSCLVLCNEWSCTCTLSCCVMYVSCVVACLVLSGLSLSSLYSLSLSSLSSPLSSLYSLFYIFFLSLLSLLSYLSTLYALLSSLSLLSRSLPLSLFHLC